LSNLKWQFRKPEARSPRSAVVAEGVAAVDLKGLLTHIAPERA
jgi:hypothetical protein